MNMATLVRASARSILKNRTRALLTVSGVVIGVAAVIVMVAVGQGARDEIKNRVTRLGTNLIVVTPGAAQQGAVSQGAQSFTRLTVEDADAVRRQSLMATEVSPVIVTRGQLVGGEGNWRAPIYGVHTDYFAIRNWSAESGVTFSDDQVRAARKVALLGKTVAEALFPGADPVGQRLRIRDVPFDVVGVMERKGQTAEGADQDDVVIIPYTTAQTRLAGRQYLPQILASTASPADVPAAQEEIRESDQGTHRLAGAESDDFTIRDQSDLIETASATTRVMTVLLRPSPASAADERDRHHEHHAGVGDGADAGSRLRLAVGARGSTCSPVPGGVGRACLVGGAGHRAGVHVAAALQSLTGWRRRYLCRRWRWRWPLGGSRRFFGSTGAQGGPLDPIEALARVSQWSRPSRSRDHHRIECVHLSRR
jgi:hypothetical protein